MKLTAEHRMAVLLLGAIIWLIVVPGPGVVLSCGDWFEIPGDVSTAVSLSFQFDTIAIPLLLVIVSVTLLNQDRPSNSKQRLVGPVIFVLVSAAVLLTDLVAILVIWTLLGLLFNADRPSDGRTGSSEIVLHLSSVFLLAGFLVGTARYHSTDMLELMAAAASDDRIDARPVAAGLSVWLAAAAAVRCGLFPALLWLHGHLTEDSACRFRQLLTALIPGLAVAIRLMSTADFHFDGSVLLAGLGALTAVVAGMIAVAQTHIRSTVALLGVTVAASVCSAGLEPGPGIREILLPAVLLQFSLIAVLLALVHHAGRTSATLLAGVVLLLCSGLAGQNALVCRVLVESAGTREAVAMGYPLHQFSRGVWTALGISQLLFGFALVKAVLQARTNLKSGDRENPPVMPFTVAVGVVVAAFLLPGHLNLSPSASVLPAFVTVASGTPALLLGAVVAWLMFGREKTVKTESIPGIVSLARISRNWFYLDRVWSTAVSLPVRLASAIVRAVDTHLIRSGREEAWKYSLETPAAGLEHLRGAGAVYCGLTITLLVVGLLLVLR